jgi:hypothetical protein
LYKDVALTVENIEFNERRMTMSAGDNLQTDEGGVNILLLEKLRHTTKNSKSI